MIRSALFAPGSAPRMMSKALASTADAVILDLEDAVSPDEKDAARARVAEALLAPAATRRWVRVNPVNSVHHLADIERMLQAGPDALVLPKADAASLRILSDHLEEFEAETGGSAPPVIALIETCRGLIEVADIAAQPRVVGLMLGAEDLTAELGVPRTAGGEEIMLARQQLAIAARAYDRWAIDTPNLEIRDADVLRADLATARRFGMTAKACIHPNQVPVVREAFLPSAEEIEWAQQVNDALSSALAEGRGACALDGKMIDAPVAARAQRILAEAARTAQNRIDIKEES